MHPVKARQVIALKIAGRGFRLPVDLACWESGSDPRAASDPAQLILRRGVIQQRKKAAHAAGLIVDHLRDRRGESQLGAASVDARIVSEALGVAADVELIVSGPEVSGGGNQLAPRCSAQIRKASRH